MARVGSRGPPLGVVTLKRIAQSNTDPARRFLLVNCVETYIELANADEKEWETMIAETQNRDALEERLTWAEKIELKAHREGEHKGKLAGLQESLTHLLEKKFGPLPSSTRAHIESLNDQDKLHSLFDRAIGAKSLEEVGFGR